MWSWDRDPKPLRDFVTVTANGGLGTTVIVNGQILQGATCAGGEFGIDSRLRLGVLPLPAELQPVNEISPACQPS